MILLFYHKINLCQYFSVILFFVQNKIDITPLFCYIHSIIDEVTVNEEEQNLIDLVLNDMTSNLGVLIKAQRDKKKMSGRELARQSKVSSAVISDIECFKYIPKMEVI